MFEKIIVATGGSPWSNNAVRTAVQLAADVNGQLLIAHVLEDDPQYGQPDLDPDDPQVREQMEETGRSILQQATGRAEQAEVAHTTHLVWGSIPEQLVRLARTQGCDLIVMGTRHLTGDKRLMTGRICNAVVATSPCPVLVVPLVQ
jgi:nucleotide-binding universal stress UspA family protein